MNLCICFILQAFMASFAYAVEFSEDDVRMFLPFLKNLKPLPQCPPNELYKNCMGNCSDCTNRGNCVTDQCIEGCDCTPRFYRLEPGGPCVPVAKCPIPECGENEVFRECGPLCERCTTFRCRIISCDHKCYCKEGYLRNSEGKCVPKKECPKKQRCSFTEAWSESGPVDEFCIQGNTTEFNKTQDVEQCYCKPEYKRNTLGFCIKNELCSLIHCLGQEVYHDCVPKCNTTCRNYGDPNCIEDDNCYPGCFCPTGYVMNDFRACIPVEECKPDAEQILVVINPEYEDSTDADTTITIKSDESTIKEDTTEISTSPATSDDDKTSTVSVETTPKPLTSSTARVKEHSNKASRKIKPTKSPKSSSAATSAVSSKDQSSGNEDYFDNEEI